MRADVTMMRDSRPYQVLAALRASLGNHLKSIFDLTPAERKIILLVAALFILGLIVKLVRLHALRH